MSITPREPADFTPSRGNYTELKPFRFWCQKVLPLVYDDSLSYYELLCKVVDFLNKTMEDVETLEGDVTGLHTAYVELQTYVNDYFSTLDVQEEINNKLDDMAESGELNVLIAPLLPDLISEWLEEHLTPTTPPIDNTLSIEGAGADAKKVGDTFKLSVVSKTELELAEYTHIYEIPYGVVSGVGVNTHFVDIPSGVTGSAFIHVPYQGILLGYYMDLMIPYNPVATQNVMYYRISNRNGALFDWKALKANIPLEMLATCYKEIDFTNVQNVYDIDKCTITTIGNASSFSDLPSGYTGGSVLIRLPYQGNASGYYLDVIVSYANYGVFYTRIGRLGENSSTFPWRKYDTRLIPISKSINELSDYSTIYSIPFATMGHISNTKVYTDKPANVTGGAFMHFPYDGSASGYYMDVVIPYAPVQERGKLYYRISSSAGEFYPWMYMNAKSDITLISYTEPEINSYNSIYQIPFACAGTIGANTHFSDVPVANMGGSFIHMPYQGTKTGYYMDIVIPYNPANVVGNMYFRISNSNGALFDWKVLHGNSKLKYVAFGDSITRGFTGSGTADNPYPKIVGDLLNFNVFNEGVDGTGWFADNNNTGSTGYSKIMAYNFSDCYVATVALGVNDYLSTSNTLSEIETRVKTAIEHMITSNPQMTIIFITPLNTYNVGNVNSNFAFGTVGSGGYTLKQFADKIEEICAEYSIPCINQVVVSPVNKINHSSFLTDGLHPTNTSYVRYGRHLAGAISKYFKH